MKRINITLIAMFIITLISLTTVSMAAEHLKKAEIKFTSLKIEDKSKIETITMLLKGVSDSNLEKDQQTLTVQYNPSEISCDMIVYTLSSLGYNGNLVNDTEIATKE